ncbi:hypothetical protein ABZS78_36995, partial [Streptomyces decoyicus]
LTDGLVLQHLLTGQPFDPEAVRAGLAGTGFACHLRRDVDAVTAGLTLHSITSRKAFARAAVQMMRWHDDQPR